MTSSDVSISASGQVKIKFSGQNILYGHQYGFRSEDSTTHPIIHLLNHCASSSSKHDPETTLAILCDLSKAFDVIYHDIPITVE